MKSSGSGSGGIAGIKTSAEAAKLVRVFPSFCDGGARRG